MSTEKRKLVEFEGISTTNWVMSPLPRPRIVRVLRRLLRAPAVPEHLRSAPAGPVPSLDTSDWPEGETRIAGVRLRVPPGLDARELGFSDLDDAEAGEVLVGLWEDRCRSMAIWTAGKPEYPIGVYNMRQWPILEEWSESKEWISRREAAIAAFRVSLRRQTPKYEVVAYWPLDQSRWVTAAAHAESRGKQEEFLAALRTFHISEKGP